MKKWNANEKNAEQKNVNRSKVKFLKPTLNVKVTLNKNCQCQQIQEKCPAHITIILNALSENEIIFIWMSLLFKMRK